jgi:hypothetical protein
LAIKEEHLKNQLVWEQCSPKKPKSPYEELLHAILIVLITHQGLLRDLRPAFTLGVGANVQPNSSIPIGAKVETSPGKAFYTRSQG